MIDRLGERWRQFSLREQRLILLMLTLAAGLLLWLGIVRPVLDALAEAEAALIISRDRVGAVREAVDLLGTVPARPVSRGALAPLVEASAGEAGFELQTNAAAGSNGVSIAIPAVRPPALFGWLAALERQGIRVETIDVQPASNQTVAVHALLRQAS